MNVLDVLASRVLVLDGGTGTLLQAAGLLPGELPERWNLSHPAEVRAVHRAYFDAGSHVVATNTFGANALRFSDGELEEIVSAAVENVREAAKASVGTQPKFVALDVGPTGKMLKPYGDLDFEDAVEIFAKTVRLGVRAGVDLIVIETMSDSYETKAALLAAKENSTLPVFVTNAYGADGKLMTGATPEAMVALLEGMGADAIGANCSLGPEQLRPVIERMLAVSSTPVIVKPNAGLPAVRDGKTVYDVTAEEFAASVAELVHAGVRAAGGCCGTTPEYLEALCRKLDGVEPLPVAQKNLSVVSSFAGTVTFGKLPIRIGERLNPTGKKRLRQALAEEDMNFLLEEALRQQEAGCEVLDVNVGSPEIDEERMLSRVVTELQAVTDLPLQIDSANAAAMEKALRLYNGKAMVNSVNGKEESMRAVFPLVKKYGGLVVALTLDEKGVPATAEERFRIAERILAVAAEYGISEKDLIFDPLALTVSADPDAASVTLETLRLIRERLGAHTSLGISNVSFGLPARDAVNAAFYLAANEAGLNAAILNPYSTEIQKSYHTYRLLHGLDENCADYIAFASRLAAQTVAVPATVTATETAPEDGLSPLRRAVVKGLRDAAASLTSAELQSRDPMRVVEEDLIPALDTVGAGYEKGSVYLPQLLMSAEAAKCAFSVVREAVLRSGTGEKTGKMPVVLATVKGDIHDIGKNIVHLLLENYGFAVTDLGRDVPSEEVVAAVRRTGAPLVGLSALMTTTLPAMEETVRLLKKEVPGVRVIVGGAVLTREYAERIGADAYGADAMETVRYAESVE